MIEIRIRHDCDAKSLHLCEWPATDLDLLLGAIGAWGIHTDEGEYLTSDLTGQIAVNDTRAFFEIIIVTEDDV